MIKKLQYFKPFNFLQKELLHYIYDNTNATTLFLLSKTDCGKFYAYAKSCNKANLWISFLLNWG